MVGVKHTSPESGAGLRATTPVPRGGVVCAPGTRTEEKAEGPSLDGRRVLGTEYNHSWQLRRADGSLSHSPELSSQPCEAGIPGPEWGPGPEQPPSPPSSLPWVDRLDEVWVICCSQADSVSKTCEDFKVHGLEVDDDDGEELVEDHNTDLTTEELQDLQKEQQQTAAEELSSEEEGREDFPTSLIKEMLGKWGEMQSFVEKYHPNKEVANCAINLFNDNAVFHFRPSVKTEAKTIITG
ncbi:uncharacterized protein LOC114233609 [Eptesicus fuscus]|uniref:uncharacterized protein LOC114233609 n=1 Tax=Eptesicus fuscus TaxID=29078 RepID=UPI002403F194|nr:uncharacterized protein LOC114233609 [Eptesicus fuscus]